MDDIYGGDSVEHSAENGDEKDAAQLPTPHGVSGSDAVREALRSIVIRCHSERQTDVAQQQQAMEPARPSSAVTASARVTRGKALRGAAAPSATAGTQSDDGAAQAHAPADESPR